MIGSIVLGLVLSTVSADADAITMIGKKGLAAALAGKQEEICAGGVWTARYHETGTYELLERAVDIDGLIADVDKDHDKIACVVVHGVRPPRKDIERMGTLIVEKHGVSVFLPDPAKN